MNTRRLFIKIIFSILGAFIILCMVRYYNVHKNNIFENDVSDDVLNNKVVTIENGNLVVDGDVVDNDFRYVYSEKDLSNVYDKALEDVIYYSNDVNILGDITYFLKYLQAQPKIVCTYSENYVFKVDNFNKSKLIIDMLNSILDINIVMVPVSEFEEDNGIETVLEVVKNGQADIGCGVHYPFQIDVNIQDLGYKVSKPYGLEKVYFVSLDTINDINLEEDKIAIVNTINNCDESILNKNGIIVTSRDEAVEMLHNGEIDYFLDISSDLLIDYAKEGLYTCFVNNNGLTGINYLVGYSDYAEVLIKLFDEMISLKSIKAIDKYSDKKNNYDLMYCLKMATDEFVYTQLDDNYIDLGTVPHIGMISIADESKVEGYTVDMLLYLSKALGLNFRIHNYSYNTYEDITRDLNNNKIDAVLDVSQPTIKIYDEDIISNRTLPYLSCRFDILKRVETESINSLNKLVFSKTGTVKYDSLSVQEFFDYELGEDVATNLIVFDTYDELIDALRNKEIDYAITYPGLTKFMSDNGQLWCVNAYDDSIIRGVNSNDFYIKFGDNDRAKLIPLLNIGIGAMDNESLEMEWFYTDNIYNSIYDIAKNQKYMKNFIYISALILILAGVFTLRKKRNTEERIKATLLIDDKTLFGNRYEFSLALQEVGSVYCIMMKIPKFNQLMLNITEEESLLFYMQIANRIRNFNKSFVGNKNFRFTDDEFVILINNTNDIDINIYLEDLSKILKAVYVLGNKQMEIQVQLVAIANELIDFENDRILMYLITALNLDVHIENSYTMAITSDMIQKFRMPDILDELLSGDIRKVVEPFYLPIYSVKKDKIVGLEVVGRLKTENLSISSNSYIKYMSSTVLGDIQKVLFSKFLEDRDMLIKKGIIDEKFKFSFSVGSELLTRNTDDLIKILDCNKIDNCEFLYLLIDEEDLSIIDVIDKIKYLEVRKVRFTVNDFNVGHSSLGKIISLGLNAVKVTYRANDKNELNTDLSLFEALIKMVKEIDVSVLISNINSDKDYKSVISNNVDYLQGDYFLQSVPVHTIEKYLKQVK